MLYKWTRITLHPSLFSILFTSLFSHRTHFLPLVSLVPALTRAEWRRWKDGFPGIQDYVPSYSKIISPAVFHSKYLKLLLCAEIWEITTILKRGSWTPFASCNTCNFFYLRIYFRTVYWWTSFCISGPFLGFWQDSFKFLTWSIKFVPHGNETRFLSIM